MKVQVFEKKRDREREREREIGYFKSWVKELKVIYLAYDYNFTPTLTLAWLDRLSMISSARAFLGWIVSLQFFLTTDMLCRKQVET